MTINEFFNKYDTIIKMDSWVARSFFNDLLLVKGHYEKKGVESAMSKALNERTSKKHTDNIEREKSKTVREPDTSLP